MKELVTACFIVVVVVCSFFGCAAPSLKKSAHQSRETVNSTDTTDSIQKESDSSYVYSEEESLLNQILECYDMVVEARMKGDFGFAETKVENALQLSKDVKIDEIRDENLVAKFKEVLSALAQEYGKILNESSITAEEDPVKWFEDIDAEQFKSGQWTDEELKKIIMKIATKADVPIEYNENVRNTIYYFQNGGREFITKCLKRRGRYIPMIQEIFAEEGLPLDMAYLSMIESGFNPRATSRARAVGLWQFIYTTGKIYGLKRNQWVDERRDPVKATIAAAKHLRDLYELSDDWNNVMAAYNCGARRIRKQLEQTQNLEYWNMELPRETTNYVPIFMAALVISKAPEIFGFTDIQEDPPLEYDTVEVEPYSRLSTVAECAGCTLEEIQDLNPELLLDRVPPDGDGYLIRIHRNSTETFLAKYSKRPAEKYEPPKVTSIRVKRGDTFSSIARSYGVSESGLKAANIHIKNFNRLQVGQKINIPRLNDESAVSMAGGNEDDNPDTKSAGRSYHSSKSRAGVYRVQKNDTLGLIASKFTTTIKTIQELNNMGRSTKIYLGQRLLVPKTAHADESADQNKSSSSVKDSVRITYIVQKNDTLFGIARKYGVDYRKIKELNNIKDHTKIIPGQKLIIEK